MTIDGETRGYAGRFFWPQSAKPIPKSFNVPSDRRLVIEYVSGRCSRSGDVTGTKTSIFTSASGVGASHVVHLMSDELDSRFFDVTQQLRIYADPGSSVYMNFSMSFGPKPAFADCTLALSGYTVTK